MDGLRDAATRLAGGETVDERRGCVRALTALGDSDAGRRILRDLVQAGESPFLRASAASALWARGGVEGQSFLRELAKTTPDKVLRAKVEALQAARRGR